MDVYKGGEYVHSNVKGDIFYHDMMSEEADFPNGL